MRGGEWTKVPYSPLTGVGASSTAPETWAGYQEAARACKEHGYDGIGFVFTPDDELCGVDLDKCLDPDTGEIEGWAEEIIKELDSYTETSPSGRGVHILVRGKLSKGRNRKGRFEAYDRGRYFTVTGKHLAGTPQCIENREAELRGVVERVFGSEAPESTNGHTRPVVAPESMDNGLSDEEIIRKALAASNGESFSRLWSGDTSGYGSHSEADLALCGMLAFWSGGDAARIDALFRQSGLYREKWDRKDYRNRTIAEALNGKTAFYKIPKTLKLADGTEIVAEVEAEERKPTQAELLVRCAAEADLFHTPAGDSYATVSVGDHHETHPIKAKGFRRWLVRAYFERYDRPPGNQALQDALGLLEARAEFDGAEREIYVRVAEHEGSVYVDLANDGWQVVEITPGAWRVISGDDAPVRFRRPRGMLALPIPLAASDDDDSCDGLLRRFFNVSGDDDLRLIVAWLVAALRPTGPYPVLLFQGEQGSAKSTAERLVRALVDPSAAPLRTTPRSEHDLFIAADNAHVIALDNISTLPPWLSDALCRLSTGGGFSTRTLYENREEELFDGMKPAILNGITDVANRPDLLDRAIVPLRRRIRSAPFGRSCTARRYAEDGGLRGVGHGRRGVFGLGVRSVHGCLLRQPSGGNRYRPRRRSRRHCRARSHGGPRRVGWERNRSVEGAERTCRRRPPTHQSLARGSQRPHRKTQTLGAHAAGRRHRVRRRSQRTLPQEGAHQEQARKKPSRPSSPSRRGVFR
jgi:hypothetical protein